MSIKLAPSTWLKDEQGTVLAGPGDVVTTLTSEEEASMIRTGSAERIEPADEQGEGTHG